MEELKKYIEDDGQLVRKLTREDGCGHEDTEDNIYSDFLIVFNVSDTRYKCYIAANSMDEALGIFFTNHPHITYELIEDHFEE